MTAFKRPTTVIPAKAGIQYAAACRFNHWHLGILDHPPSRVMTAEIVLAARCARGCARNCCPMKIRGRREGRMRAAPAVSQAVCKKICCPRAYRFSGEHPAFPAQWLYGLYDFVLVTGLFATIVLGGFTSADLTPAPGRRTQTISPYAMAALVSRSLRVHRSLPLVRDDGQRPFRRDRMAGVLFLICPTGQQEYFSKMGLTLLLKFRNDLPVGLFCRSHG